MYTHGSVNDVGRFAVTQQVPTMSTTEQAGVSAVEFKCLAPCPLVVGSKTSVSGLDDHRQIGPIGQGMARLRDRATLSNSQTEDVKSQKIKILTFEESSHDKVYVTKKLSFCGNMTETAKNVPLFMYFSSEISNIWL